MAITTYSELLTAMDNWLARSDLTSRTPEFVALAEADIYRRLRVREMETSADLTISSQTVALPSNFLEARRVYLDTDPIRALNFLPPQDFWPRYLGTNTGYPRAFTIEGENFVFGPEPDSSYTGKLVYWRKPDALANSANGIFTANPDLFLYGSLVQAIPFINEPDGDGRFARFNAMYEHALKRIEQKNKWDRFGGAPLQIRADVQAGNI